VAFEITQSSACPPEQRKLLIAAGLFTEALAKISHPAAEVARVATLENVLFVIWLRLLEMARTIENSCFWGYSHEQQGVVRSMVSAASDLLFISHQPEPTRWAMLYVMFSIERRKKISGGFVDAGIIDQETFEKWDKEADEKERAVMEEAASKGMTPAEKFNRNARRPPQTWSGLSDADIIDKTGRKWYPTYYVPFSDYAHASVMTAAPEMKMLQDAQIEIGPRYPARILIHVAGGMCDTLSAAAEALDAHFKLGKATEIAEHERRVNAAHKEYRAALPPGIFEEP
jgi:hypothetical protein